MKNFIKAIELYIFMILFIFIVFKIIILIFSFNISFCWFMIIALMIPITEETTKFISIKNGYGKIFIIFFISFEFFLGIKTGKFVSCFALVVPIMHLISYEAMNRTKSIMYGIFIHCAWNSFIFYVSYNFVNSENNIQRLINLNIINYIYKFM